MSITSEHFFEEAKKGNLEVLKSDLVGKVNNKYGETPLHLLACIGKTEVLNHPSVDKVKNKNGWTPLHFLAWNGMITQKHLKEKYPWFKIKDGVEIDVELITKILSTPNSLRFILGD